jgi:hypothetical protein
MRPLYRNELLAVFVARATHPRVLKFSDYRQPPDRPGPQASDEASRARSGRAGLRFVYNPLEKSLKENNDMAPRTIRSLVLVMAALGLVVQAPAVFARARTQAQKPDALLGTWDVKMEDGSREFVWEFSLKDGQLAGKFTGASGTVEMAHLTFEDGTVKFSVTVGNGMVIDFSAVVAEGQLSGMLSLEYGEAPIVGAKRK